MLSIRKCIPRLAFTFNQVKVLRCYSMCCPPKPPSCGKCKPAKPPCECKPGPVAPNPCVPRFHKGKDTWKKYKYLALLVLMPIIIMQSYRVLGLEPPHKQPCRDYEYMRIRSKRFPWGDGVKTLFHNDHVNHLPGECEPPPVDCDD